MNEFNLKLQEARVGQHKLYARLIGVLSVGIITVVGVFAYATGTTVNIIPRDAEVVAKIRVVDGVGVAISKVIYALSETPRIVVSAKGFKSETKTLKPEERGGNVVVALSELPGRLIATTTPQNELTRWTINGQRVGIAATLEQKLFSGTYHLEINNPFFEIEKRDIQISRDEKNEVIVTMRPVEGQLNISSKPPGATVSLNDTDVGQTPITLKVKGGKHRLKVVNADYKLIIETIEVSNSNRNIVRNYRLLHHTVMVKFRLSPQGGILLVNGRKIDPAGPYTVNTNVKNTFTYSLSGYFSKTRKVRLETVEPQTISIRLKPEIGKVEIKTDPSSTIFVNGTSVGETPMVLKLPSKRHSISLRRTGYQTIKKEVVPSSERITVIQEKMQTKQAARLSEAPRNYVNSAGVELVLFEPTSFEMGAPRHEKGQRANEFQRKIKLSKPFYAGKHEVTNFQLKKFKKDHAGKGGDKFPATSISWQEAAEFCNWLSRKENLTPFYIFKNGRVQNASSNSDGYRMLTEAEWEWLARRASRRAETVFPWGNKTIVPPMAGNIADESAQGLVRFYVPNYTDSFAEMAPVGSFPAEISGLFDITGNASEWVHDFYSLQPPISNTVEVNPLGPTYGGPHVVKGSSWRSGTRTVLRAAFRDGLIDRRDDVGFRIGRYL